MSDGKGELILYRIEDGRADVHLRAVEGTAWLTQAEIAELFDTTKQNVSLHIRNMVDDGELLAEATVKESLTVQTEDTQHVSRTRKPKARSSCMSNLSAVRVRQGSENVYTTSSPNHRRLPCRNRPCLP